MTVRHLVALVALFGACSSKPTPSGDPAPGSQGSAAVGATGATGTPTPITGPTVRTISPTLHAVKEPPVPLPRQESFTLVDAGQGAKSELRYVLAGEPVEYRTELVLTTRELQGSAYSDRVTLPPIREGFAITAATSATGTVSLGLRPLDAQVVGTTTPAAAAYVAAAKGKVGNRRATVAIDARGQLGAIGFNDDPTGGQGVTAADEVAQRLLGMMVPLPAEAVAVGAAWRVTTILRLGPLYVKQTANYQLAARAGTALTVHVQIRRTGEQQLVADPNLPPKTSAELIVLVRNLAGDVTVDLAKPLATSGTLALDATLHARITPPSGAAIEQLVEDTGTLTLSSGPAQ